MGSLQKLREAADAMGWSVGETLTRVGGTDHSPNFKCDLRLCGRAVACESAGSKQDAKERAANSALLSITEEPSSEFADMVAEMVLNKWLELSSKEQRRSLSRTVVAGIVMERERNVDPSGMYTPAPGGGQNKANEYQVISLGAGTAHRPSAEVAERPAPALNDCHAEILSRRAFVKFLYTELEKAQALDTDEGREGEIAGGGEMKEAGKAEAKEAVDTIVHSILGISGQVNGAGMEGGEEEEGGGGEMTEAGEVNKAPDGGDRKDAAQENGAGGEGGEMKESGECAGMNGAREEEGESGETGKKVGGKECEVKQPSIFLRGGPESPTKFILRPGIRFHLYISVAPCGDASCCLGSGRKGQDSRPLISIPSMDKSGPPLPSLSDVHSHWPSQMRSAHGKLRAKLDSGESLSKLSENNGPRFCKMSCSDKILRWNVCGLQGSLLSNVMDPIYLSSISVGDTFGGGYSHADMARAVCCRLDTAVNSNDQGANCAQDATNMPLPALPEPYRINHPALYRSTFSPQELNMSTPSHGDKCPSSNLAATWARGEGSVELICDAKNGLLQAEAVDAGKTHTSILFELAQQQRWIDPTWGEFTSIGPPHAPRFKIDVTVYRGIAETIVGVGEGKTKSAAQHAAAAMALVSAMPTTSEPSTSQRQLWRMYRRFSQTERQLSGYLRDGDGDRQIRIPSAASAASASPAGAAGDGNDASAAAAVEVEGAAACAAAAPIHSEVDNEDKNGSFEYNEAKIGSASHREVSEKLHSHFKNAWGQVWLRRKLPGQALPILPKVPGGPRAEKKKGGSSNGSQSPRLQQPKKPQQQRGPDQQKNLSDRSSDQHRNSDQNKNASYRTPGSGSGGGGGEWRGGSGGGGGEWRAGSGGEWRGGNGEWRGDDRTPQHDYHTGSAGKYNGQQQYQHGGGGGGGQYGHSSYHQQQHGGGYSPRSYQSPGPGQYNQYNQGTSQYYNQHGRGGGGGGGWGGSGSWSNDGQYGSSDGQYGQYQPSGGLWHPPTQQAPNHHDKNACAAAAGGGWNGGSGAAWMPPQQPPHQQYAQGAWGTASENMAIAKAPALGVPPPQLPSWEGREEGQGSKRDREPE